MLPSRMLTRIQVARRLGKSVATVRRLEGAQLHPYVDASGVHRFDVREVERLARRLNVPGARLDIASAGIDAVEARYPQLTAPATEEGADEHDARRAPPVNRCGYHLEEIARLRQRVRDLEEALTQNRADAEAEASDELRARRRLLRELLDLRASSSSRRLRQIGPELLDAMIDFLG